MTTLFCCDSPESFRPQKLTHQQKFTSFEAWADYPRSSSVTSVTIPHDSEVDSNPITPITPYAIQFVRQVNYGPLESKRYFIPDETSSGDFIEITEQHLIQANYQKLNSYKNFKCTSHNKFFEVNLYQKDPVNVHHWRANIARPAGDIDL
ncbi:hypothetical protein BOTNAR_0346g00020 [Botryotinia narcissicola]|uniref:Uncharacterized protein n=1 Tax=Botryotinia narcissicola TaxID=278944 RepID=A0A4Z1HSB0_9HELO|nr:hypothetical protein BOTNAR_0346g00020 [Botryotinia narcissicola]